jgi:hypothetical protein
MAGAREQALERWDEFVQRWLDGADEFPAPFGNWWSSYGGKGIGAPTREALPELYIGNWGKPRLVTLPINPGAADLGRVRHLAKKGPSSGLAIASSSSSLQPEPLLRRQRGSLVWRQPSAPGFRAEAEGDPSVQRPSRPGGGVGCWAFREHVMAVRSSSCVVRSRS